MTQMTSIKSYYELTVNTLGALQKKVLSVLEKFPNGATDREIIDYLQIEGNSVRPRRFELWKKGIIEQGKKRKCYISGKLALTWKLPTSPSDPVFKVLSETELYQTRFIQLPMFNKLRDLMRKRGFTYQGQRIWKKNLRE